MRSKLLQACALSIGLAAAAQSKAQSGLANWANLSHLQTGQKIHIVEVSAKKHSGTFLNVSDTALSIHEPSGDESIQKQDVRSVKTISGGTRHLRNALVGTAIGAGAGAGVMAGIWESHGFLGGKGDGALAGAAIGGFFGAIGGAFWSSHSTVYTITSH